MYLTQRQPASFLATLRGRLLLGAAEQAATGTRYDCPLLNALVFYVGIQVPDTRRPELANLECRP